MNAEDVDFSDCAGIPCELPLRIECTDQTADRRGRILSPGFPKKIKNESQFGIVFQILI